MARFRIALNNSAGELDAFEVDADEIGPEEEACAMALRSKLDDDWRLLSDGDTITIREMD